jgi:hypothetical protein
LKGHDFSRADKANQIKLGFSRRGMLSMKLIVIKRFSAASLALEGCWLGLLRTFSPSCSVVVQYQRRKIEP